MASEGDESDYDLAIETTRENSISNTITHVVILFIKVPAALGNPIDTLLSYSEHCASKTRQGKLSELICTSSEGKEGLDECSVEVWFREIIDLVCSFTLLFANLPL